LALPKMPRVQSYELAQAVGKTVDRIIREKMKSILNSNRLRRIDKYPMLICIVFYSQVLS